MFMFTDGTKLTNAQAAALIRAEPWGLLQGSLVDLYGHRCAGGVVIGSTTTKLYTKTLYVRRSDSLWEAMVKENNAFIGTPAERREHMAIWFEKREDD